MHVTLPAIAQDLDNTEGLQKLIEKDETLSEVCVCDEDISKLRALSFTANEVRFEKVNATEAKLERTGLSDVEFLRCDLIATALPESSWRRVSVKDSHCSGLQLQTSTLRDVTFTNCKLSMANFRFSRMKNV